MSSGSRSWDSRSESERRIFHNFWNNKFGEPLTANPLRWSTKRVLQRKGISIIYGSSHRKSDSSTFSKRRLYIQLDQDSFGGYYSGDDNSTVYLTDMSDNMSDLNDVGERSQVPPLESSTFIQNVEGSAVPAGNREVNLGRGVNEEHNTILNPLAPPTGFGRLSGGIMYPLPNTSSPEGFPTITPSPRG